MATLKPNQFTTYEWDTTEEELQANILNTSNVYMLQNKLAFAAIERANLTYDVNNPLVFVQREAALAGEMAAYSNLLSNHNDALHLAHTQSQVSNI